MGIYLGGGNIGMAEHHLNGPEIRTPGKKMGGKGVPEHVRTDCMVDAGCPCPFFDDLPEASSGHGTASVGDKQDP